MNAISSWLGYGVTIIVGILLTPFVVQHLGKEGYGIWALIGSIIGYYGLTQLGVASAINRYVARYAAQKDHQALNETVSTALAMFSFIAAFLILLSFVIAEPLAHYFNVSEKEFTSFKYAIWAMGGAAAISMLGQVFRSTFSAHEFYVQRNLVLIFTTLLRAAFVVLTVSSGWGLLGVAFSYFFADFLSFIIYIFLTKRMTPWVRPSVKLVHWYRLKTLLNFGIFTSIIAMANIIRVNMDSVVIARLIDLESLAIYSIAAVICRYFSQLIDSGMGVLIPRMSGMHALDDMKKFRLLLIKSSWIASALTCAIGLALLIAGDKLIFLWVGEEYKDSGIILIALLVGYLVSFGQKPGQNALFAINKHKFFAIILLGEAICNLSLSLYLAPRMGILGVALGTVIPLVVVKVIIQPIYTARMVEMTVYKYLEPTAVTIAIVAIIYHLYLVFVAPSLNANIGYFSLAFLCAAIVIVYFAMLEIALRLLNIFRHDRSTFFSFYGLLKKD